MLLDFSAVTDIEYTALAMLTAGEARLAERHMRLWIAGLNPHVLEIVRGAPLGRTLGEERMFFDVSTAVAAYERATGTQACRALEAPLPVS